MDEKTPFLDLRILPDWLKEQPAANPYADFPGEDARPGRDKRDRPGQGREDRSRPRPKKREARPGDRRDHRGPRPQGKGPPRAGHGRPGGSHERQAGQSLPPAAEPLRHIVVEFFPDSACAEALAAQVKASHKAYPIFSLARMFLEKADRYRVRLSSNDPQKPLYQAGDGGLISLDAALLEKEAFQTLKDRFYIEETIQRDPPKGNYTNIARHRQTGTLLGPTNHHGYQPALRKLYEERFSRRMSFQDFTRDIEVLSDPALIAAWKETLSSAVTYKTRSETGETVLDSAAQAEEHFRKHYFPQELKSGQMFEITGDASRNLIDRRLFASVRNAWEKERGFPGQLAHHLRRHFMAAGLHIFKHRKRVLFVSPIRPAPFTGEPGSLSENIARILQVVGTTSRCTRAGLAAAILPQGAEDPARKMALVSDLIWLIQAGHVIEFFDGALDLPLPPGEPPPPSHKTRDLPAPSASHPSSAPPPAEPAPLDSPSPAVPEASEQEVPPPPAPFLEEPAAAPDTPESVPPPTPGPRD